MRRGPALALDYWGGLRTGPLPGVALDVRTGALIRQFQTVHHTLFDYDPPAQPTPIEVKRAVLDGADLAGA